VDDFSEISMSFPCILSGTSLTSSKSGCLIMLQVDDTKHPLSGAITAQK
jgi:hypothetical protein